jgi:uncharacterized membrane protein YphA (DoxX/SURF4 family)
MKYLRHIARIISGLVFIFSGLSKGVDPMGSMYKFIDYFTAFGLDSLNNLALILGIILCTAEFIIGFAILTGIRIKEASWGLLIFMAGFTPLTLILAINNPVSDCGCFGDAIHLTNWQTFFKNVIILAFVLIVFFERRKYKPVAKASKEWIIIASSAIVFLIFIQLNYRYLPFIDFRPYNAGTNIHESMIIPEDAPVDEYEVSLLYEKDGEVKEFTINDYPSDSSWVFVDQKSTLIKKGYVPPIHDFSLTSLYGEDLTELILSYPGYTIMGISTIISETPAGSVPTIIELGTELKEAGFNFYFLTSSSPGDLIEFNNNEIFISGDETTIKTIVRSNPGLMLMKNGVILKKWSFNAIPEADKIMDKLAIYEKRKDSSSGLRLILLMSLIAVTSYIINLIFRKTNKS